VAQAQDQHPRRRLDAAEGVAELGGGAEEQGALHLEHLDAGGHLAARDRQRVVGVLALGSEPVT
jgi:hypothetical protein